MKSLLHHGFKRFLILNAHGGNRAITTFIARETRGLADRLRAANVVVSLSGTRIRVSPAVFNGEADVDALAEALS